MAADGINVTKIVGVVADVRRDAENDYACSKCCLFGINEEEYHMLGRHAKIVPTEFNQMSDRHMVHASPWNVMGENFGYHLTVTPLGGRVEGPTGERRTCIFTMVSAKKTKPNPL
jgi:hypothetical protein